jgi:hypothetical protein
LSGDPLRESIGLPGKMLPGKGRCGQWQRPAGSFAKIREIIMALTQVVLVDRTHSLDSVLLNDAALALNTQVAQDLAQVWPGIAANVSVAPSLAAVPQGAWPVFLVKKLPPGEGGFHLDTHNQPYAKVIASPDDQSWTVDASHEIIEMLVDPYGNRMQTSQAIAPTETGVIDADGTFSYLVEACDPCEANDYAYDIAGIAVSDFITPNFYDASVKPNTLYSFKGNITRPRQVLPGGYISYVQPDGTWNQILWVDPATAPTYGNPDVHTSSRSWRETIHQAMGVANEEAKHLQRTKKGGLPRSVREKVSQHHAFRSHRAIYEKRLEDRYGIGEHMR